MNIDRLAPWYRSVEYLAFGRALEEARFAFLDRLASARRILVLGEGDGRALEKLLSFAPSAEVDVHELSGRMIELARQRIGNSRRVRFEQGDAQSCTWPLEYYDGVVTLFFLDCFSEPEAARLMHRIASAMAPGGMWLVSDFAIPANGWRRWHAKAWTWVMYGFFHIATGLGTLSLPGIEPLLSETGLRRVELVEARFGLIRSEVWKKLC
jgi:ubiquinone/menaquinone biosynthesis C-methylase UbiE